MAQEDSEEKMPFFDHVEELRARLMRSIWVFLLGFAGSYYFLTERVMEFLRAPLFKVIPPDQRRLYFTSLFENFLTHLKVSGYLSVALLSPYFLFQIWGFVAPGLYPKERKLVVPFFLAGIFFFLCGAGFAYYALFPVAFKFFVQYGSATDMPLLTIDSFYSTCIRLLLLFGLAFEMPVLITLLGILGIVDVATLRAHRKTAILAITVLSAMFAPPDAISMLVLMCPLVLMYEGAIAFIHFFAKKRPKESSSEDPQA